MDFETWKDKSEIRDADALPVQLDKPGGRILIAEDDLSVCQVLRKVLSPYYQVDLFQTAQTALDAFARGDYQLAIVDLGLPSMPGDQLVARLKQQNANLATLIITGWDLQENDPRRDAFDFYVQKPFHDIGLLQEVVSMAVQLYRTRVNGI